MMSETDFPEAIPIKKTEEEGCLTKQSNITVGEFSPVGLEKFKGGSNPPLETTEHSPKIECARAHSDEEGSIEMSDGGSFLESTSATNVASEETRRESDHYETHGVPNLVDHEISKDEKIVETVEDKVYEGSQDMDEAEEKMEKENVDHDTLHVNETATQKVKTESQSPEVFERTIGDGKEAILHASDLAVENLNNEAEMVTDVCNKDTIMESASSEDVPLVQTELVETSSRVEEKVSEKSKDSVGDEKNLEANIPREKTEDERQENATCAITEDESVSIIAASSSIQNNNDVISEIGKNRMDKLGGSSVSLETGTVSIQEAGLEGQIIREVAVSLGDKEREDTGVTSEQVQDLAQVQGQTQPNDDMEISSVAEKEICLQMEENPDTFNQVSETRREDIKQSPEEQKEAFQGTAQNDSIVRGNGTDDENLEAIPISSFLKCEEAKQNKERDQSSCENADDMTLNEEEKTVEKNMQENYSEDKQAHTNDIAEKETSIKKIDADEENATAEVDLSNRTVGEIHFPYSLVDEATQVQGETPAKISELELEDRDTELSLAYMEEDRHIGNELEAKQSTYTTELEQVSIEGEITMELNTIKSENKEAFDYKGNSHDKDAEKITEETKEEAKVDSLLLLREEDVRDKDLHMEEISEITNETNIDNLDVIEVSGHDNMENLNRDFVQQYEVLVEKPQIPLDMVAEENETSSRENVDSSTLTIDEGLTKTLEKSLEGKDEEEKPTATNEMQIDAEEKSHTTEIEDSKESFGDVDVPHSLVDETSHTESENVDSISTFEAVEQARGWNESEDKHIGDKLEVNQSTESMEVEGTSTDREIVMELNTRKCENMETLGHKGNLHVEEADKSTEEIKEEARLDSSSMLCEERTHSQGSDLAMEDVSEIITEKNIDCSKITEVAKHDNMEDFVQQIEPVKEEPKETLDIICDQGNKTTASNESVDSFTFIEEKRSIEESMEATDEISTEKIDKNEENQPAEAEFSNKNVGDVHISHSFVDETTQVEGENPENISKLEPEEQVQELNQPSMEEDKHIGNKLEENQTAEDTNLEQPLAEETGPMQLNTNKCEDTETLHLKGSLDVRDAEKNIEETKEEVCSTEITKINTKGDEDEEQIAKEHDPALSLREECTIDEKAELSSPAEVEEREREFISEREVMMEQIIEGNATCSSPEPIEEERMKSQNNEKEEINENIITESSVKDISLDMVGDGQIKDIHDNRKESEKALEKDLDTVIEVEAVQKEARHDSQNPEGTSDTTLVKQEENLQEVHAAKEQINTEGNDGDISRDVVLEDSVYLQNDEKAIEKSKKEELETEAGGSISCFTSQDDQSPERSLDTPLMKQEEISQVHDLSTNPIEAITEDKTPTEDDDIVLTKVKETIITENETEKDEDSKEHVIKQGNYEDLSLDTVGEPLVEVPQNEKETEESKHKGSEDVTADASITDKTSHDNQNPQRISDTTFVEVEESLQADKIDADEENETKEVELSNRNVGDIPFPHSSVDETTQVQGEIPEKVSKLEPEDRVPELSRGYMEEDKHIENEVSEITNETNIDNLEVIDVLGHDNMENLNHDFVQQNEMVIEKPQIPLDMVAGENETSSRENVDSSPLTIDEGLIKTLGSSLEGKDEEEKPSVINEMQIDADEKSQTTEVECPQEFFGDIDVPHSLVDETSHAESENLDSVAITEAGEQTREWNESKEENKHIVDKFEAKSTTESAELEGKNNILVAGEDNNVGLADATETVEIAGVRENEEEVHAAKEQIIIEGNDGDISRDVVLEDSVYLQDDEKGTKKSKKDELETEAGGSISCFTSQSPERTLDTSSVKQEESSQIHDLSMNHVEAISKDKSYEEKTPAEDDDIMLTNVKERINSENETEKDYDSKEHVIKQGNYEDLSLDYVGEPLVDVPHNEKEAEESKQEGSENVTADASITDKTSHDNQDPQRISDTTFVEVEESLQADKIYADEENETVEVELSNRTVGDIHFPHSLVDETTQVHGENPEKVSKLEPEDRIPELSRGYVEEDKHIISELEAKQSTYNTELEQTSKEGETAMELNTIKSENKEALDCKGNSHDKDAEKITEETKEEAKVDSLLSLREENVRDKDLHMEEISEITNETNIDNLDVIEVSGHDNMENLNHDFVQQNEMVIEKPQIPLDMVAGENETSSRENVDSSTLTIDEGLVKTLGKSLEGKDEEEKSPAINEMQIDVDEKSQTTSVEHSKEIFDNIVVSHSLVDETSHAESENLYSVSKIEAGVQAREWNVDETSHAESENLDSVSKTEAGEQDREWSESKEENKHIVDKLEANPTTESAELEGKYNILVADEDNNNGLAEATEIVKIEGVKENVEEVHAAKEQIITEGNDGNISRDVVLEDLVYLQDDEKGTAKSKKEELETGAGGSISCFTGQDDQCPERTLDTSLVKQEESSQIHDLSTNSIEAITENKSYEEKTPAEDDDIVLTNVKETTNSENETEKGEDSKEHVIKQGNYEDLSLDSVGEPLVDVPHNEKEVESKQEIFQGSENVTAEASITDKTSHDNQDPQRISDTTFAEAEESLQVDNIFIEPMEDKRDEEKHSMTAEENTLCTNVERFISTEEVIQNPVEASEETTKWEETKILDDVIENETNIKTKSEELKDSKSPESKVLGLDSPNIFEATSTGEETREHKELDSVKDWSPESTETETTPDDSKEDKACKGSGMAISSMTPVKEGMPVEAIAELSPLVAEEVIKDKSKDVKINMLDVREEANIGDPVIIEQTKETSPIEAKETETFEDMTDTNKDIDTFKSSEASKEAQLVAGNKNILQPVNSEVPEIEIKEDASEKEKSTLHDSDNSFVAVVAEINTFENPSDNILADTLQDSAMMPLEKRDLLTVEERDETTCETAKIPYSLETTEDKSMRKEDEFTSQSAVPELRPLAIEGKNGNEDVQMHLDEDKGIPPKPKTEKNIPEPERGSNDHANQSEVYIPETLKGDETLNLEPEKDTFEDRELSADPSTYTELGTILALDDSAASSKIGAETEKATVEVEATTVDDTGELTRENLHSTKPDEKLECTSKLVAEDESTSKFVVEDERTIMPPETNHGQSDENNNIAQDHNWKFVEEQIIRQQLAEEHIEPKSENQDHNDNTEKQKEDAHAIAFTDEVHNRVEKDEESENFKENIADEENKKEGHIASLDVETVDKVEISGPVSTQYLKKLDSEHREPESSEKEIIAMEDLEAREVIRNQGVSGASSEHEVQGVTDSLESKHEEQLNADADKPETDLCKEILESRLGQTQLDDKPVEAFNDTPDENVFKTTEPSLLGDEVDSVKLEETTRDLVPQLSAFDHDETEKESIIVEDSEANEVNRSQNHILKETAANETETVKVFVNTSDDKDLETSETSLHGDEEDNMKAGKTSTDLESQVTNFDIEKEEKMSVTMEDPETSEESYVKETHDILGEEKRDAEAVATVQTETPETSFRESQLDDKVMDFLVTSDERAVVTSEANLHTDEVDSMKLEETSSHVVSQLSTCGHDKTGEDSITVEDPEHNEVNRSHAFSDASLMSEDRDVRQSEETEAEKNQTAEKLDADEGDKTVRTEEAETSMGDTEADDKSADDLIIASCKRSLETIEATEAHVHSGEVDSMNPEETNFDSGSQPIVIDHGNVRQCSLSVENTDDVKVERSLETIVTTEARLPGKEADNSIKLEGTTPTFESQFPTINGKKADSITAEVSGACEVQETHIFSDVVFVSKDGDIAVEESIMRAQLADNHVAPFTGEPDERSLEAKEVSESSLQGEETGSTEIEKSISDRKFVLPIINHGDREKESVAVDEDNVEDSKLPSDAAFESNNQGGQVDETWKGQAAENLYADQTSETVTDTEASLEDAQLDDKVQKPLTTSSAESSMGITGTAEASLQGEVGHEIKIEETTSDIVSQLPTFGGENDKKENKDEGTCDVDIVEETMISSGAVNELKDRDAEETGKGLVMEKQNPDETSATLTNIIEETYLMEAEESQLDGNRVNAITSTPDERTEVLQDEVETGKLQDNSSNFSANAEEDNISKEHLDARLKGTKEGSGAALESELNLEGTVGTGESLTDDKIENETVASQILTAEKLEERLHTSTSPFPIDVQTHSSTITIKKLEKENMKEDETLEDNPTTMIPEEPCLQKEEDGKLEAAAQGIKLNDDLQRDSPSTLCDREVRSLDGAFQWERQEGEDEVKYVSSPSESEQMTELTRPSKEAPISKSETSEGPSESGSEVPSHELVTKSEDVEIVEKICDVTKTGLRTEEYQKTFEGSQSTNSEVPSEKVSEKLNVEEVPGDNIGKLPQAITSDTQNEEFIEESKIPHTHENIEKTIETETKIFEDSGIISMKEETGKEMFTDEPERKDIAGPAIKSSLENQNCETISGIKTGDASLIYQESDTNIPQGTMVNREANEIIPNIGQKEQSSPSRAQRQIPEENFDETKETVISTMEEDVPSKQNELNAESQELGNVTEVDSQVSSTEHGGQEQIVYFSEKATDSNKMSLSDLLHKSKKETLQMAEPLTEESTASKEEMKTQVTETTPVEEPKTDGDDGEEHEKIDSGSDAPVIVEASRDIDVKVAHKKSHGILSGMGSKVKHSISKVKKVITGKSTHPKELSPK